MKSNQPSLPRNEIESVFSLYSNGDFELAIDQIKALNQKYPNEPLLFNLIGACYREIGNLEGAAKMFDAAVTIQPDYAEAHFNLGVTRMDLGQNDAAIESYRKAIIITPNYPDAHNNLGKIFLDLENYNAAIESFEWAIAYQHDLSEAHNNLGNAFNFCGRAEEAIKSFEKAILYNPDYDKAYFNLALTYKDIGNKDGFIKNIEKSLDIKPQWGAAFYHLSQVVKCSKNDPKFAKIHSLLDSADLNITDRIHLNFALAKSYEDIENYREQFKFLDEGNRLRKQELNYSIERDIKLFSRIKEAFNPMPICIDKSLLKPDALTPIFILGMPRSGTSLVHQILDSHNQVYGAGELNNLNKSVFSLLKENNIKGESGFSAKNLLSIHNNYLDSLLSFNIQENVIVDKMPLNFRYIGFILLAFPKAKILHMKRNPMAICWSIYKSFFNGNAYSFNQEDLAQYYLFYEDLMDFWAQLFPNQIYDVCYEDLTTNQELETRNILEYCELDWDENCLNFHKNNNAVKTTSSMQVRKKMYQGSSEAWKKYEAYLEPLINGLG